jgi:NADH:ubiquinone oxidoreductase subunit E/NAD-dependent dihydropyrimidine dehydrogenase PreA subunit
MENHPPTGVCRVCVVEVEGARTLVGSCHTPISEGMVIHTRSQKVLDVRRGVVELMLSAHTGMCVNDPNAEACRLHNLASDHEVGAPRFTISHPRFYSIEDENPYVRRDLSKCILCRKCIIACNEIAGKSVLSIGYRGFESKVIAGYDEFLSTDECRNCGICIEYCPTGALSKPPSSPSVQTGLTVKGKFRNLKPSIKSGRTELLPLLKKELRASGCLSPEVMNRMARQTDLSVSEIFGVSSFYSFLPREGNGTNRIRICRCVPCALKEGQSVITTLQEELGIGPGEITPDGKFSLELVGCIGACDQAPAMLINDELFGNLSPEKTVAILKEY